MEDNEMGLQDDLQGVGRKAGGSHLTIEARERHLREFARWCKENNYQIQRTDQIREKHIRGFMDSLKARNGERTRQNKLAALRVVIRETGKTKFADGIKTRAMGVQSACRDGTKRAMTEAEYKDALARVAERDQGCASAVELCREFGLRRTEAVMADAKTLARWAAKIERGQRIDVIRGTKGGRPRDAMYPCQERARAAVAHALAVARANGGHIVKVNGGLKQSVKRLTNVASASGLQGKTSLHSLRYSYATERLNQLIAQGYDRREAASIVSQDLGHGDGRINYVLQVYARQM
jgi:site-specific recombinase XerD